MPMRMQQERRTEASLRLASVFGRSSYGMHAEEPSFRLYVNRRVSNPSDVSFAENVKE